MNAVDTNILLYARDSRYKRKQEIAISLIENLPEPVLIWQVACEYIAASRKLETADYAPGRAWSDMLRLSQLWPLRLPTSSVLQRAQSLYQAQSLSTWDALLIAACLEADVTTLYTEDLQNGVSVDSLKIVNPFL